MKLGAVQKRKGQEAGGTPEGLCHRQRGERAGSLSHGPPPPLRAVSHTTLTGWLRCYRARWKLEWLGSQKKLRNKDNE